MREKIGNYLIFGADWKIRFNDSVMETNYFFGTWTLDCINELKRFGK